MHNKKIISVIGSCSGAGSTFISTSLAFVMAQYKEGITYLEGDGHGRNHSLPIYELSLDKHISQRRFVDFFAEKEAGKIINNRVNLYRDVNWVVRFKGTGTMIKPDEVAGEYVIWDNPPHFEDSDLIICIIDILPSRVLAGRETVNICNEKYKNKTLWVFNKANKKQDTKEAEKFLKIRGDFNVPMQRQEDFYEAQELFVSLMDPGNRNNMLSPKPSPKLNAVMEEIAQYILTLY